MSGRSVSPGAALLRSSRMFSMPTPIPSSPGDFSTATKHHSQTATIPFPTHLSVTTPSSSRITGDWGFKRPFPLKKTTKTTIPLLRIRQVDSPEHVTDFQSSSDHAMTLKKYQEMHLPLSVPSDSSKDTTLQQDTPKSVFEDEGDVTSFNYDQAVKLENKRWKFKGPWLAGMTEGDFKRYLDKEVRSRRSEFRTFLKEQLAAEMTVEQRQQAMEANATVPPEVTADAITETQLIDYLKELRVDRPKLYLFVGRFLDLAPIALEEYLGKNLTNIPVGRSVLLRKGSPYGATGPPITHPSAGLSYLRSPHYIYNHPFFGPQAKHAPVRARVLVPRSTRSKTPWFGVGGFAVQGTESSFNEVKLKPELSGLVRHELGKYGGAKFYVGPQYATIDSTGRAVISAALADKMAAVVQGELVGEKGATVLDDPTYAPEPRSPKRVARRPGQFRYGSSEGYGLDSVGGHARSET
ncbi:mitochondrial ribosomal protein MRP51 [Xylariomycetidae sp. FL2044]|nr:mitochondrial ribosomal protein MRP51 [Xylariomycetidae sp. FL2044]